MPEYDDVNFLYKKYEYFLILILITFPTGLALALTAVGSAANHRWPSTDPCGCIKYFWPASEEEIKAVQEFFKTKTVKLQQVREVI